MLGFIGEDFLKRLTLYFLSCIIVYTYAFTFFSGTCVLHFGVHFRIKFHFANNILINYAEFLKL